MLKSLSRNKFAWIGGAILLFLAALAITAPWFAPRDPNIGSLEDIKLPPLSHNSPNWSETNLFREGQDHKNLKSHPLLERTPIFQGLKPIQSTADAAFTLNEFLEDPKFLETHRDFLARELDLAFQRGDNFAGQWLAELNTLPPPGKDRQWLCRRIIDHLFADTLKEGKPIRHWLGTDEMGRDLWSRLLHGSRISLVVGFISVGFSLLIGVPLGAFAGYRGGLWDTLIMRTMDIMLAFPSILLAITIVAVLEPNLTNAMVAVGIVGVPVYTRLVRASVLTVRELAYVDACRSLGATDARILFLTILPNCLGPIIVQSTLSVGTAILEAASLSFLGLGAQPPTAEWGAMLAAGFKENAFINANWLLFYPGLAIMLTVLGFNLLGDALRDSLDPRLRKLT